MLILGIDPGTARLGIGLIETTSDGDGKPNSMKYIYANCLETSMDSTPGDRLFYLEEELAKIVSEYKPDVACVEMLFFGINARTAIAVGQARGVILATLAKYKIPQIDYQGLSVKFAVTGFGKSDKKQMQEAVRVHLGMKEVVKPDDAADGLALAITHYIKLKNGDQPKAKPKAKPKKAKKKKK